MRAGDWRQQRSAMWEVDAFTDISKTTYTYDGGGHLTHTLSQMSGDGGSTWMDQSQTTNTLDGLGRDTLSVSQSYDSYITHLWTNTYMFQSSYDGSSNKILGVYWNWIVSEWSKVSADTMKYENEHLAEAVHYIVGGSLTRTKYTYNASWNETEVLHEQYSGAWENVSKSVYVYQTSSAVLLQDEPIPSTFDLRQNYPNPFNPTTVIRYSLFKRSTVEITVFNVLGQEVKRLEDGVQAAGVYETSWDGTDRVGQPVASGVYFYQIKTGDFSETRKMMLLK